MTSFHTVCVSHLSPRRSRDHQTGKVNAVKDQQQQTICTDYQDMWGELITEKSQRTQLIIN